MIARHMTGPDGSANARAAAQDLLSRRLVRLRDGDLVLPVLPLPDAE